MIIYLFSVLGITFFSVPIPESDGQCEPVSKKLNCVHDNIIFVCILIIISSITIIKHLRKQKIIALKGSYHKETNCTCYYGIKEFSLSWFMLYALQTDCKPTETITASKAPLYNMSAQSRVE